VSANQSQASSPGNGKDSRCHRMNTCCFRTGGNVPHHNSEWFYTHTDTHTHAAAHLEGLVTAGFGLLLPQSDGRLVGCRQLVPLEHQRLLKLLLRLRLQQRLPEGDVREEGGERPAQLYRRLGAFLWERGVHYKNGRTKS